MKPRLKLLLNGRILVVRSGSLGWSSREARTSVKQRYGSVSGFAARFHVSQGCAYAALTDARIAVRAAGQIAFVRQVLGLPSHPSEQALRVASARLAQQATAGASA